MSYNLSKICQVPVVLLPAASRVHVALMVLVPILTFAMLAHFFARRHVSMLTMRRSRLLVTIVAAGIMCSYVSVLVMDYSAYPCWLRTLLDVLTVPLLISPLIMRLAQYRSAVALRQRSKYTVGSRTKKINGGGWKSFLNSPTSSSLSQPLQMNGSQDLKVNGPHDSNGSPDGDNSVAGETATSTASPLNTFRWILQLFRLDSSRASMEFATRPEFFFVWLAIMTIPYLLFFGILLWLDPQVLLCAYCHMNVHEVIVYLVSLVFLIGIGLYIAAPLYKKQPDPLGMVKEFMLVWTVGGSVGFLSLLLHGIDPGQLYFPKGEVVWRWILFVSELLILFFQTTYQFIEVRRWRRKALVLGSGFSAKGLFKEIYDDLMLRSLLRAHMQAELNDEGLCFLEEVDAWKLLKDGKQRTARAIFDTYLHRGAPFEVNISSANAYSVVTHCERGNVTEGVFNECVDEVRNLIVVDILPRFLESKFYKQHRGSSSSPTSSRMAGILAASMRLDSHSSVA